MLCYVMYLMSCPVMLFDTVSYSYSVLSYLIIWFSMPLIYVIFQFLFLFDICYWNSKYKLHGLS